MSVIDLSFKDLKTLKGQKIPEVVDYFNCSYNQLTSLEFGPIEVVGDFFCVNNYLTSFEFCANKIGRGLNAINNSIENLKGIHKQFENGYIGRGLYLRDNPLKSNLLGVILIPRLQEILIDYKQVEKILNTNLKSERDVLECQEELIQNGFKEFAQL